MATRQQLATELVPELKNNGVLTDELIVTSVQAGGAGNLVDAEAIKNRDTAIQTALDTKLNKTAASANSVMRGLEVEGKPNAVFITSNLINLDTGEENNPSIAFPVASPTQQGVMPVESVLALDDALIRISVLEDGYLEFATTTPLTDSAKQTEIQAAFEAASGLTTPTNATRLLSAPTGLYWRWSSTSTSWIGPFSQTILPFTNNTLGSIMGENTDGKVYAEADGTGSVVGWQAVKTRIANNTIAITTGDAATLAAAQDYADNMSITADRVTGTFDIDRIPNLPASDTNATPNTTPLRDANGRFKVVPAVDAYEPVALSQVNAEAQARANADTQLQANIDAVSRLTVEAWNTATKTLALSDANKLFTCAHTANQILTIPTNESVSFPIGTMITFLLESAYTVTFVGESGVTLTSIDSLVVLSTQYGMASLIKISADTWQLVGALT